MMKKIMVQREEHRHEEDHETCTYHTPLTIQTMERRVASNEVQLDTTICLDSHIFPEFDMYNVFSRINPQPLPSLELKVLELHVRVTY